MGAFTASSCPLKSGGASLPDCPGRTSGFGKIWFRDRTFPATLRRYAATSARLQEFREHILGKLCSEVASWFSSKSGQRLAPLMGSILAN